jgi:hypothetical protein
MTGRYADEVHRQLRDRDTDPVLREMAAAPKERGGGALEQRTRGQKALLDLLIGHDRGLIEKDHRGLPVELEAAVARRKDQVSRGLAGHPRLAGAQVGLGGWDLFGVQTARPR